LRGIEAIGPARAGSLLLKPDSEYSSGNREMHAKARFAKTSVVVKANLPFSSKSIAPFHSMRSPAEGWLSLQGRIGKPGCSKSPSQT
jgi:hypothetical protein